MVWRYNKSNFISDIKIRSDKKMQFSVIEINTE